jgi:hypothetical protein
MKHTNQEQSSKNQETADQHKKASKSQQGVRNEAGDSASQTKGNREQHHGQADEGANWQKGKQGNRK